MDVDSLIEAVADEDYNYDEDDENSEVAEAVEFSEEEYDASDFELRRVDKDEWNKIKKDKRFQYKKKKPKKKKKKKSRKAPIQGLGELFNSGLVKIVLYILFGGFLIYIIYLFIKNNDLSFKRNVKDEEIVQEEPWENVQEFEDWELALRQALKENDYRLATRIYYLQTLNILDKAGQIKYREDKTNWYYVQQLSNNSHYNDFMQLTRSFDYIWYGEYQISAEQFGVLESQFKNFHDRVY